MNILVTGSNGQLGSEIKDLEKTDEENNFFFRDLPELDICNISELENFIVKNNKCSH